MKRAIELIPGLKITGVEYMECGSCLWMLVEVLLWGREIVVAEGRKERLPCASTLLLSGKFEGELSELHQMEKTGTRVKLQIIAEITRKTMNCCAIVLDGQRCSGGICSEKR